MQDIPSNNAPDAFYRQDYANEKNGRNAIRNGSALAAKIAGLGKSMPPGHLIHFGRERIGRFLRNAGFSVLLFLYPAGQGARTAPVGQAREISLSTVLWWGRFDPGYSRNRILRKLFAELGWQVEDFRPKFAGLADWEARLHRLPRPDLVWLPCFRQRDLTAASRWANRHGVPLVFDPLISAYDKQVDERGKLNAGSSRAQKLLAWERALFRRADRIIADTSAHADYFAQVLGVPREQLAVIHVGAEESLFKPERLASDAGSRPLELLFYGSFIPLQGPQVVVEAARLYRGPPARWVLLGQGPLRRICEEKAEGLTNVAFEDWMPYEELPARIHRADILLGVFGTTPKAGRVIPNKVFQSLACGRPVITRSASAYPEALVAEENSGLVWTPAGDAQSLADRVAALASNRGKVDRLGIAAAETSHRFFSGSALRHQLSEALEETLNDSLIARSEATQRSKNP